jgi:tetratricopeptide (TPR) repeat protein
VDEGGRLPIAGPGGLSGAGLSSLSWAQPLGWTPLSQSSAASPVEAAARAREASERGLALYNRMQSAQALECFQEAVSLAPDVPAYHHQLAGAADDLGRRELGGRHLLEAVRLDPGYVPAQVGLSVWYGAGGDLERSLHHSAIAYELAPADPGAIVCRGNALLWADQAESAWAIVEPVIEAGCSDRWVARMISRLGLALGREAAALRAVEHALAVPNLLATRGGKPVLHYAAAKLLERLGRYDEAFEHARLANELVRSVTRPFDIERHSATISHRIAHLTRRRLRALPRASHGDRRPLFIVGMPRSGTTLVEQILATHPAIVGGGELRLMAGIGRKMAMPDWAPGERYPQSLDHLSPRGADRLAAEYLAGIDAIGPGAKYVTDKMPDNFLTLELVELLLPEAHVIHCTRNPLDTCVSCHMTGFEAGSDFALDLSHLGTYWRDYRRLMEHWKEALSVPILDVRYEDIVLDTETQVRRILEFLNLPWEPRCLEFYKNKRPVRTASEDQVRRPVYVSSVGRWKHYERHLGALFAALGGAGSPAV